MNKLKRIVFSIIAAFGFIAPMAAPVVVSATSHTIPDVTTTTTDPAKADIDNSLACGANLNFTDKENCESAEPGQTAGDRVNSIVTQVINILSLVVGVAAVIMIIIGGLRYITSNGDSGQVTNAKNTILYAVVGLIVVALAQIIVRFVVNRATGPAED